MKAHKITQKNFALYVGVPYGTYKDWLCYGVYPDAYTMCNIADALGVSVEYLVRGADGRAAERREREVLKRKNAAVMIKKYTKGIEKHAEILG